MKKKMDTSVSNGDGARNVPRDGDYIQWDTLPPGGALNRWSHSMTKGHDYVGAQVSLRMPLPGPRHVMLIPPTCTRQCSTPLESLTARP